MRRSFRLAPLTSGAWASVELIGKLLEQVVLDGVVGDVGIRLHAHLLQDARPVGAYRLDAQEQFGRDLRNALTLREFRENLKLPLRQHAVTGLVGRTALDAADEQLRELRTDITPAPDRRTDRAAKLSIVGVLADEAASA